MENEKYKLERQIVSLIVIIILLIFLGYLIYIRTTTPPNFPETLSGDILYLSNISDPNNTSIGVWLEIKLYMPKKANLDDVYIYLIMEESLVAKFQPKHNIQTINGYYFEYNDSDENNMFSSGDKLHLWGKIFTNWTIIICIRGYDGTIYFRNSHPQIDDDFNGLSAQDGDTDDGNYANRIYP